MRKPDWVRLSTFALGLVTAFSACRSDPTQPPPLVTPDAAVAGSGGRGGSGGRSGSNPMDAAAPMDVADAPASGDGLADGSIGDGAGDGASLEGGVLPDGSPGDLQPGMALRPFYSHPFRYPQGVIMPTAPQAMLDAAVASYYDKWKAKHLASGCGGNYLKAGSTFGGSILTVSQIHGYGMLAAVIMAGHDMNAQETFDGFFRVARMFKSSANPALMAYEVRNNCVAASGPVSQTDGDLDIALALLMADKQWGSGGTVNYLQEARTIIAAIKQNNINTVNGLPLLGDWVVATDTKFWFGMRTADFMPNAFRQMATATNDPSWMTTVENGYALIASIQQNHSAETGLLPDFIQNTNNSPSPAPANWSTSGQPNDGQYFYEACRIPVRLALDFFVGGGTEARAKAVLAKINTWLRMATGNNPNQIRDGYRLNGTILGTGGSFAFEGPFGVASMVDVANQEWLNAIWQRASTGDPNDDVYADTIRLLSLIIMSGNWWPPYTQTAF